VKLKDKRSEGIKICYGQLKNGGYNISLDKMLKVSAKTSAVTIVEDDNLIRVGHEICADRAKSIDLEIIMRWAKKLIIYTFHIFIVYI